MQVTLRHSVAIYDGARRYRDEILGLQTFRRHALLHDNGRHLRLPAASRFRLLASDGGSGLLETHLLAEMERGHIEEIKIYHEYIGSSNAATQRYDLRRCPAAPR